MSEISYDQYVSGLDWVDEEKPNYPETPPKGFLSASQLAEKWHLRPTATKTRIYKLLETGMYEKVLVKKYGSPQIIPYYGKVKE